MMARDDRQVLLDTALQVEIWARDPWQWMMDCVWTLDEADGGKIKRLPNKPYLQRVVEVWQSERLLAIPKSRIFSWPPGPTMRLDGLMSRCAIERE